MSLTTRLTLAMVGLVLVTAGAVGWLTYRNLEAAILPTELARLQAHVRRLSTGFDDAVIAAMNHVAGFANAVALNGIMRSRLAGGVDPEDGTTEAVWRERFASRLASELAVNSTYLQFRVIGAAQGGREILRVDRSGPKGAVRIVPDDELLTQGDREYFLKTMQLPAGAVYVSPIELNEQRAAVQVPRVPVMHTATPVFAPNGERFGIVAINLDMRPIVSGLRASEHPGGVVYVVNERGDYLVHPDPSREFGFNLEEQHRLQEDFPNLAGALLATGGFARLMRHGNGKSDGVAFVPLRPGGGPWTAIVEMVPEEQLLHPVLQVRRSGTIAGSLAAIGAILIAVWLARSLTRPLVQMTSAIDAFASDRRIGVPATAPGELGVMARAFERMGREVREQTQALRESEERLRQAVRVSHIGIFDHDHRTDTIFCSPEQRRNYGFGADEPVTLKAFIDRVHPEDREATAAAIRRAHDPSGDGVCDVERRIILPDGEIRWLSTRSQTYFEGEGEARRPVRTVGAVLDITESKRAEQALRQSEERLRQCINVSHIGVFDHDHHTDTIFCSPEERQLHGFSTEEPVTLKGFLERLYPGDREAVARAIRAAHDPAANGLFDVERRIVRPDGEIRWVSTRSQSFFEGEGDARRLVRTVGADLDITERKRAEAKVNEWKARYEAAIQASGQILYDWDTETNELILGGDTERILGYTVRELGRSLDGWLQLVHPEDRPAFDAEVARSSRTREPFHQEYRMVRKDGGVIEVLDNGYFFSDAQGRLHRMVGFVVDVTARKQAERALAESEYRFRQLVESVPQLVWTCQSDGLCDFLSPQWVQYTGVPASKQLGSQWRSHVHPDDQEGFIRAWGAAVDNGSDFEAEFRLRRHDGVYRWFNGRAIPLRDVGGRITKWFGSNSDVHEAHEMRETLQKLNVELEQRVQERTAELQASNRELESFSYSVSHDLRAPLRHMSGFIKLLRKHTGSTLDAEASRYLDIVFESS